MKKNNHYNYNTSMHSNARHGERDQRKHIVRTTTHTDAYTQYHAIVQTHTHARTIRTATINMLVRILRAVPAVFASLQTAHMNTHTLTNPHTYECC